MITFVIIIHVIVSIGLILVVLLQTGKGADMGAVFGGSSATIFGSSGAGNFLTRLTTGMAIVFMITSLTLGYASGKKPSSSVFDRGKVEAQQPARRPQSGPATTPQAPAPSAAPQPQTQQPEKPASP